jgi:hypothetical protein
VVGVPLWMPLIAYGVLRLLYAVIYWCARIRYEQVRAASMTEVLRVAQPGTTVRDIRADGASLFIEISPWPGRPNPAPEVSGVR